LLPFLGTGIHKILVQADPSGRAVEGVGPRPLACWDCRFEAHQGNGVLFVVR